ARLGCRQPTEANVDIAISRRGVIVIACLTSAAWAGMAQAAPESIKVQLIGTPAVQTSGSGTADLTYDPSTRVLTWRITYGGLAGPGTMVQIPGPGGGGKNGPGVIWVSKQGSIAENPIPGEATLTPEQAQQFTAGEWYINVHTQANPAGEVRGQIKPLNM